MCICLGPKGHDITAFITTWSKVRMGWLTKSWPHLVLTTNHPQFYIFISQFAHFVVYIFLYNGNILISNIYQLHPTLRPPQVAPEMGI